MRASIGGGWHVHHLSDRVVELRKDDYAYRRFTGRDGFVRVRIEPQMTRQQALERAIKDAQKTDELLALRIGNRLLPSKAALAKYQGKQMKMVNVFGVKGEEGKVYRP